MVLAALVLLFTGAVLGICTLVGGLVLAFFALTRVAEPEGPGEEFRKLQSTEEEERQPAGREEQQQEYDDVVREMLQSTEQKGPPHRFAAAGGFSGWVWTIPSSKYNVAEALENWPPPTEAAKAGAVAVATKWWGSLRGRTLYLARSSGLEKSYLVPVLEVDVSDCRVEVLKQGLKSKSKWWRKCPIQVSHEERDLLHRETSFALFAEGSAAKEQWYNILQQASGSAPARQAVEELYLQFCQDVKDGNPSRYPQLGVTEKDGSRSGEPEGGSPRQKGKWGRLFSKRRNSPQKARPGDASASKRSGSPLKKAAVPPGFLNPTELDQAWMGKGAVSGHLAAPGQGAAAPATLTESKSADHLSRPSAASTAACSEDNEPGDGEGGPGKHAAEDSAAQAAAAGQLSAPQLERLKVGSKSVHFPVGRGEGEVASPSRDRHADEDAGKAPSHAAPSPGAQEHSSGDHVRQEAYPKLPVEHFVNMLLGRVSFDVLRSPDVKAALKAHMHRKLNELRFPSYMHGIEIVDIDMGSGVPSVHNLRAMPTPGSAIWPQMLMDFEFDGEITVVIETKLDLRDGVAWSQFDKAINRLEGGEGVEPGEEGGEPRGDSDDEIADSGIASPSTPPGEEKGWGAARRGIMANIIPLRQRFAKGIRQIADITADHVSKMQLKLRLDIKSLKGPIYVWMPPPPGDRLWFSFVTAPQLVASATPLVGGRLLKYSYQAGRVSQWIASKLQSSMTKNMVYPSCSDIPLPFLMAVDHPSVAFVPPNFLDRGNQKVVGAGNAGASTAANAGKEELSDGGAVVSAQATVSTPAPKSAMEVLDSPAAAVTTYSPEKEVSPSPPSGGAEQGGSPKRGFWSRKRSAKKLKTTLEQPAQSPTETQEENATEMQPISRAASQAASQDTRPTSSQLQRASPGVTADPDQPSSSHKTHMEPPSKTPSESSDGQRPSPAKAATSEPNTLSGSEDAQVERPTDDSGAQAAASPSASAAEAGTAPSTASSPGAAAKVDGSTAARTGGGSLGVVAGDRRRSSTREEIATLMEKTAAEGGRETLAAVGQLKGLEKTPSEQSPGKTSQSGASATVSGPTQEALPSARGVSEGASSPDGNSAAEHISPQQRSPGPLGNEEGVTVARETKGWLSGSAEVPPPEKAADKPRSSSDSQAAGPAEGGDEEQTPAEASSTEFEEGSSGVRTAKSKSLGAAEARQEAPGPGDPADVPQLDVVGRSASAGVAEASGSALVQGPKGTETAARGLPGWQNRLAGSGLTKNWEAFKNRNPNTVQQGIKIAGAVEKLREQAQEQIRRTQEQMRKQQELKKAPRGAPDAKPSSKQA